MFNKVLLPVDMQDKATAKQSLQEASHYLQSEASELHVMAVLPGLSMPVVAAYFPDDAVEKALKALQQEVVELIRDVLPGREHCQVHIAEGNAAREIVTLAEKLKVDLIVMPSHNHSHVENLLIGSVTSRVVERAHCSVMVLRNLPEK